jgi:hypothetical protein
MKFFTLKGQQRNVNISKYIIDWDFEGNISKIQLKVKKFLQPYWQHNVVLEEFHLPGNQRLSIDIFNVTKNIAIETDGRQHFSYVPHYHRDNRINFANQIKRDLIKDDWALKNRIAMYRINEDEIKYLSKDWFEDKFDITL